jgi:hypothetical protein
VYGLTDYVIVIVVNQVFSPAKRPTNYFDETASISIAAQKGIRETRGNYHAKTDIQKQAYHYSKVTTIRQAFGITGTKFDTHTPYRNGKQLSLDDTVNRRDEIMLIQNDLPSHVAVPKAGVHRILPERSGS